MHARPQHLRPCCTVGSWQVATVDDGRSRVSYKDGHVEPSTVGSRQVATDDDGRACRTRTATWSTGKRIKGLSYNTPFLRDVNFWTGMPSCAGQVATADDGRGLSDTDGRMEPREAR